MFMYLGFTFASVTFLHILETNIHHFLISA